MDRCDFRYRGELLSDHGYVICDFGGSSPTASVSAVTTDSQRDFTSVKMFGGKYHPIAYYTYDSALVMEMSICKADIVSDEVITPAEAVALKRWLEAPSPQQLKIGETGYENYFWNGTFNVEEVRLYSDIVGFNLTFTSTAPFGYKDKVEFTGTVAANGTVAINDKSDEEGYIYPNISVTLSSGGILRITNSFDGRQTVIYNCVSGETITFTSLMQITSNIESHELGDDFNYKFVRIHNSYSDSVNTLTFSLPCSYTISYTPVGKVVI